MGAANLTSGFLVTGKLDRRAPNSKSKGEWQLKSTKGKFAQWFEEELAALAKEPRYGVLEWTKLQLEKLHNGYFAQDRKGVFKDTKGDTQADDDVYNLIMKDKEQLLSIDEPLRRRHCLSSSSPCARVIFLALVIVLAG